MRTLAQVAALAFVRRLEAEVYTDDPDDPGGPTFCGVSLRAVKTEDADGDGRMDFDLDGDGDVDAADIQALKDHPDKIDEYYIRRYWTPMHASELPVALALFAFDSAVHHGVAAAALLLQRGLDIYPDGVIGFRTLAAAQAAKPEALDLCLAERGELMRRVVERRPTSGKYFRGWQRRLFALSRMAQGR